MQEIAHEQWQEGDNQNAQRGSASLEIVVKQKQHAADCNHQFQCKTYADLLSEPLRSGSCKMFSVFFHGCKVTECCE